MGCPDYIYCKKRLKSGYGSGLLLTQIKEYPCSFSVAFDEQRGKIHYNIILGLNFDTIVYCARRDNRSDSDPRESAKPG